MRKPKLTASPPTLREVARHAKVSHQTVSRVINGRSNVSDKTRDQVLKSIKHLGYRPNSLAQSLARRTSNVIGLIIPDISQPFFPRIALGVEASARSAGFSVFLTHTSGSAELEQEALERLHRHRVAGVINCGSRLNAEALDAAAKLAPMVLVNRDPSDRLSAVGWSGYERGASLAVEHLLSLGRERIVYVGIDYDHPIHESRRNGYLRALQKVDSQSVFNCTVRTENSLRGGFDAMARIVAKQTNVDGIFAFNDLIASGILRYASVNQINIPEQLAVVGFGGLEFSEVTSPGLTTISVPLNALGKEAFSELVSLMNGGSCQHVLIDDDPKLIIRGSTLKILKGDSGLVDATSTVDAWDF